MRQFLILSFLLLFANSHAHSQHLIGKHIETVSHGAWYVEGWDLQYWSTHQVLSLAKRNRTVDTITGDIYTYRENVAGSGINRTEFGRDLQAVLITENKYYAIAVRGRTLDLLYDFTLQPGDTFFINPDNEGPVAYIVNDTFTYMFQDSVPRKAMRLNRVHPGWPNPSFTFVKGYGEIRLGFNYVTALRRDGGESVLVACVDSVLLFGKYYNHPMPSKGDECDMQFYTQTYGVDEHFTSSGVQITQAYPNAKVLIRTDLVQGYTLRIYDVRGKLVHKREFEQLHNEEIELFGLKEGVYFVELTSENNQSYLRKIVI